MGNNTQGMSPPSEQDSYREFVNAVNGRMVPGTDRVDPDSIRLNPVVYFAEDRLTDQLEKMGIEDADPKQHPAAFAQCFHQVLDELNLPQEHAQRLQHQFHFKHGPGAQALQEIGGRLGDDGNPDPKRLDPERLSQAAVARYRVNPGAHPNAHLNDLLDDLRLDDTTRQRLQPAAAIDTNKFSWIATGKLTSEMPNIQDRMLFDNADRALTTANANAPALPQNERQAMLTEHKAQWKEALSNAFGNDQGLLKQNMNMEISFNYPVADITRTGASTAASMFEDVVKHGYNLKDKNVLQAYMEAVYSHTTSSIGHTTQFASRLVTDQQGQNLSTQDQTEMGERQYNNTGPRQK